MKKNFYLPILGLLGIAMLFPGGARAQFSLSAQLRTRSELLYGQGSPLPKTDKPAFFTSQRTRLSAGFKGYRYAFFTSVQDVRVWGQDASTNNRITNPGLNGLMLHEAWGEISLLDTAQAKSGKEFSLKIGRQELLYDDSRLLGNLDWLQQARRHDAVLLKWNTNRLTAHIGAAYNQNRELRSGNLYEGIPNGYPAGTNGIGVMYKSMQFVYLGKKLKTGSLSFLALKDDFQKATVNEKGERMLQNGTWNRVTLGPYLQFKPHKSWNITASAYLQTGRDRDGKQLDAGMYSVRGLYAVNRFVAIGPGFDHTSGTGTHAAKNRTFDPLYGTPHKFWGQMDYFYAANGFGKGGLSDLYFNSIIKASEKLSLTADYHHFASAATIYNAYDEKVSSNLGSELDLIASYNLTRAISFQGGYCAYFTTPTLALVKGVADPQKTATWAYLMISIKPEFTR